jgi:hypothetical protein
VHNARPLPNWGVQNIQHSQHPAPHRIHRMCRQRTVYEECWISQTSRQSTPLLHLRNLATLRFTPKDNSEKIGKKNLFSFLLFGEVENF